MCRVFVSPPCDRSIDQYYWKNVEKIKLMFCATVIVKELVHTLLREGGRFHMRMDMTLIEMFVVTLVSR